MLTECSPRCIVYYNCRGGCGCGKYPGCELAKHKSQEPRKKEAPDEPRLAAE